MNLTLGPLIPSKDALYEVSYSGTVIGAITILRDQDGKPYEVVADCGQWLGVFPARSLPDGEPLAAIREAFAAQVNAWGLEPAIHEAYMAYLDYHITGAPAEAAPVLVEGT